MKHEKSYSIGLQKRNRDILLIKQLAEGALRDETEFSVLAIKYHGDELWSCN